MADPRQRLYVVCLAAMFVFGMLTGLPGALLTLPGFVDGFGLTLADRGAFIASLFVGLGIGSAVSGPMAEILGGRAALVASCGLVAACLPLMGLAPTYATVVLALLAVGFASAGVNTTANALVSHTFPEERGRRLNVISIAVGAGGLAMPAAAGVFGSRAPWTTLVYGPAILAALVTLAAARLAIPPDAAAAPFTIAGMMRLLGRRGFVAIAMLVALGAGNDVSMAGWTSTYLVEQGFTPGDAAAALSSYWFGLIAGRLALFRFVERDKPRTVAAAAIGCVAMLLVLVLARSDAVLAVTPFFTGMAIAVVVPTSLALGGERYPVNPGMVFGMMMTAAQVGGMLLPALVGIVAERAGLRGGMALLIVNSVIIAAVAAAARRGAVTRE